MRLVLEPGWHVAVIELVDEHGVPMDVNANVEITGATIIQLVICLNRVFSQRYACYSGGIVISGAHWLE